MSEIENPPDINEEEIENPPEDIPNVGWRPPKWKTVEELEKLINEYYERCEIGYLKRRVDLLYDDHYEQWKEDMSAWEDSCENGDLSYKTEKQQELAKPREPRKEWQEVAFETPTITWLALYLWCEIETIKNYGKKDGFSVPIKEAYLRVQRAYEERLQWTTPAWAIFALKNFEWKDKNETDHTSGWKPMFERIKVTIDE